MRVAVSAAGGSCKPLADPQPPGVASPDLEKSGVPWGLRLALASRICSSTHATVSARADRSAAMACASASSRASRPSWRRSCSPCLAWASRSRCLARRASSRPLASMSATLWACSFRSCSMPCPRTLRTSRRPAARCSDSWTTSSCSSRRACHTGSLSWRPEPAEPSFLSSALPPRGSAAARLSQSAVRCSCASMQLLARLIACASSTVRCSWPSSRPPSRARLAPTASAASSRPRARRS
mmetsp:Transcript_32056/g.88307  ORF Transcript_32056/g.88307 Transcript_32056/m.88307 type:complete len:240 (-) Transcript_32056:252-971(-)